MLNYADSRRIKQKHAGITHAMSYDCTQLDKRGFFKCAFHVSLLEVRGQPGRRSGAQLVRLPHLETLDVAAQLECESKF